MAAVGMAGSSILTGYAFYQYNHDPAIRMQVDRIVDNFRRIYLEEDLLDYVNSQEASTEAESEPDKPVGMDHDSLMDYYLKPHGDSAAQDDSTASGWTGDEVPVPEGSYNT